MKKKSLAAAGFSAVEALLVVLVLAAIAGISAYAYHNAHKAKPAKPAASSSQSSNSQSTTNTTYNGWATYTNSAKTFTVKRPQAWQMYASGETPTAAVDVVGFGPAGNTAAVTVSSYNTTKTPEQFETSEGSGAVITKQNLTINGNAAYYQETGDSTYTNLTYAVAHNGVLVSVSMTKKATNPAVDNSALVSDFTLLAKSVTLLN